MLALAVDCVFRGLRNKSGGPAAIISYSAGFPYRNVYIPLL